MSCSFRSAAVSSSRTRASLADEIVVTFSTLSGRRHQKHLACVGCRYGGEGYIVRCYRPRCVPASMHKIDRLSRTCWPYEGSSVKIFLQLRALETLLEQCQRSSLCFSLLSTGDYAEVRILEDPPCLRRGSCFRNRSKYSSTSPSHSPALSRITYRSSERTRFAQQYWPRGRDYTTRAH